MGASTFARMKGLANLHQLRHVGQEIRGLLVRGAETAEEHLELVHPRQLKKPKHLRKIQ
jgi:hypothetical protein